MLQGPNLRLEPLTKQGVEDVWNEIGEDEETWQWIAGTDPIPTSANDLVAAFTTRMKDPDAEFFCIRNHAGEAVGISSYLDIRPRDKHVEIGSTFIARRFRGGNTNYELKLLMLQEAFENRNCVRVTFKANSRNQRSRLAILRIGAIFEGELRNQRQERDGSWRTAAIYSVIEQEWPSVKAHLEKKLGL